MFRKENNSRFKIVKQMGDGSMKMGVPDLAIGCVDVRDVAEAHYQAGFRPEAQGRNIVSAENQTFLNLAEMLQDNFGKDFPLPKKTLPKWLVWLVGPFSGITRQYVSANVGLPFKADNSKSKKELGMHYRPIKETMNEFFQQLIDHSVFKK